RVRRLFGQPVGQVVSMGVVVNQDTPMNGDSRVARHDRFASHGSSQRNIPSQLLRIAREQPGQFWTQLPVVILTVAYTLSTFVVHRPPSGYSGYWDGWISNAAGILP